MTRTIAVAVLFGLLAAPAGAGDLELVLLGQAVDSASTVWAKSRGAVEWSPGMDHPGALIVRKAFFTGAVVVAARHWRRTGHPDRAKWTVRVACAVFVGLAGWNVYQGAQSRPGGGR